MTDIAPATVGRGETGCVARVVGYGRTTLGGSSVRTGYAYERRSTAVCIDAVGLTTIEVHGDGVGLCFGDSGSPMFRAETTEILGVASTLGEGVTGCYAGYSARFTSLAGHEDFLACASSRFLVPGARSAPFSDALCHWAEPMLAALRARSDRGLSERHLTPLRDDPTRTLALLAPLTAGARAP